MIKSWCVTFHRVTKNNSNPIIFPTNENHELINTYIHNFHTFKKFQQFFKVLKRKNCIKKTIETFGERPLLRNPGSDEMVQNNEATCV